MIKVSKSWPFFRIVLSLAVLTLLLALVPRSQEKRTKILVDSQPAGAELLVDGETWGRTPLHNSIKPGKHQFELRRKGFTSLKWSQFCALGETTRTVKRLPAEMATLSLKSAKGAQVYLGPGVPRKLEGQGPWKLPAGNYEVSARRDQVPSPPEKFELKPGQSREIALQWPVPPSPPQQKPVERPPQVAPNPPVPPPPQPAYRAPAPVYRPPAPVYRPVQPTYRPPAPRYTPPPPRVARPVPQPLWTPIPAAPSQPRQPEALFTPLP